MEKIVPATVHTVIKKHMLADGYDIVFDLKKSHGTYLYDSKGERELLDLFTCFASSPIGYNHPALTTKDFLEKLAYVSVNKPANSDLYTVEMAEFVHAFGALAAPEYLPHLFFVDGGALAVENALKVAFDYRMRKLGLVCRPEDYPGKGTMIIHYKEAFHGRSGYTLSMTNTFDPRKTCLFPKFKWPRVLNPKLTFPITEERLQLVQQAEQESISQIEAVLGEHGDEIAALIIEPIQGEGGDNHFRTEYMQALRKITEQAGILLIMDEVQTGMGLTGKMWAHQHFGIEPDIVAFGKKAQICGIMVGNTIDSDPKNVFMTPSRINSTFGGNLVDMVRCTKYLEVMQKEKLVANAAKMGELMLKKLNELAADLPPAFMTNVRGRGLMIAFDLPDTATRDAALAACLKNNMLVLASGPRSVRLRPPLTISEVEVTEAVKRFKMSLTTL